MGLSSARFWGFALLIDPVYFKNTGFACTGARVVELKGVSLQRVSALFAARRAPGLCFSFVCARNFLFIAALFGMSVQVYRKWEDQLEALYRSQVDFKNVGTHNWWTLKEWSGLLEVHQMFEDDSFTREEGNMCYYFAKFTVFIIFGQCPRFLFV